jgi:uncharacterized membrane protein YgdD (TMEM256/DUF423 family)
VTSEQTQNYGGTTIGSMSQFPKTTAISLLSSLPLGGWNLSLEYNNRAPLLFTPYFFYVAAFFVGGAVVARWLRNSTRSNPVVNQSALTIVLAALLYWLGATSIQTMTDKYQNEIIRIGQVYNFYAQASLIIAIFLALMFLLFQRNSLLLLAISGVIFSMGIFQFSINSALELSIREGNGASRSIMEKFSDESSDKERCEAWSAWSAGAWPEYYEQGLSVGLSLSYRHFYNKEYCSSGVPPQP